MPTTTATTAHPQAAAVRSLLHTLQRTGLTLTAVHDGEESHQIPSGTTQTNARTLASDVIESVDVSTLWAVTDCGCRGHMVIITGNANDELLADWCGPEPFSRIVEACEDTHVNRWG